MAILIYIKSLFEIMECARCDYVGHPRYFKKDKLGIPFCKGCWLD